jgi:hypothetical protein
VLNKQIVDYGRIQTKSFRPTVVLMSVLLQVLYLTKVTELLYKGEDGYTRIEKVMKECLAIHL